MASLGLRAPAMASKVLEGNIQVFNEAPLALSRLWVGRMGCVQGRELGARVRLAFRGLCCWEASVTLYLWFRFFFNLGMALSSPEGGPEGVNHYANLP